MKLRRILLALTLVAFFVGVAHVAQTTETAGVRMTAAAGTNSPAGGAC